MPFKSEAQRRYLWANEPEIARDWTDTYGSRIKKDSGGIMELNDTVIVDDGGKEYEDSPYSNKYTEEEFNEVFSENIQDPDDMEGYAQGDPDTYKQNILTQFQNYANRFGINPIKTGITSAFGAAAGIPGLGFLVNAFRSPEYPSSAMSRSFAYGAPNMGQDYGYYKDLRHGNLTGQDQFGIHTSSWGGNYPAYYDRYARDYEAGKIHKGKFQNRKYQHALAVRQANLDRIADQFGYTNETFDWKGHEQDTGGDVPSGNTGGNNYTGGAAQGTAGSWSPGGTTSSTAGVTTGPGNNPWGRKEGGRIGYNTGGITDLWRR